jgi:hypothetical protein
MMRRALIVRPALEELVARQQLEWQRDQRNRKKTTADLPYYLREESKLLDKDWIVIELFTQVLDSFEEALLILEGDGAARVRKMRIEVIREYIGCFAGLRVPPHGARELNISSIFIT